MKDPQISGHFWTSKGPIHINQELVWVEQCCGEGQILKCYTVSLWKINCGPWPAWPYDEFLETH